MAARYCNRCIAEVEDVGGACLLGHSLSLGPPTASLRDLKAESERDLQDDMAAERAPARDEPRFPSEPAPPDPITAFAPAAHVDWGPERPALLRRPSLRRRVRTGEA